MKFYYITFGLNSLVLSYKKIQTKQTLEIRNMSFKNEIKMINIQKLYLVHIGPILSTSFIFGPFCLLWLYSVDIGPIWSTLVLFNPIRFYLFLSSLLQSYSVHLGSIQSTLFPFGPLHSIWSICVHYDPFLCTYVQEKKYVWVSPILNLNLLKKYKSQTRNI